MKRPGTDVEPKIDILFAAALARPEGDERDSFVEERCSAHPEIAEELASLLAAHDSSDGFLDEPAAAVRISLSGSELPGLGDQIGAFTIERMIGKGGMGTVYLAAQREPVAREVAVKLLSPVELSPEALTRFQVERHVLCRLNHANISRFIDAGSLPDGTPYFIMDYVPGEPIDQFCEALAMPLPERVRILAELCDTVGYAHSRGVIHGDLKPSNILVIGNREEPRLRVIDFGMAHLRDSSLQVAHGGTPAFASPEQAAGGGVDFPTDIYSLGLIGYALLAGWNPDDGQDQASKTAVSLPTDLSAILAKAISRAAGDRYVTATGLAGDLRKFLTHHPVGARSRTLPYRLIRFVQRHPVSVCLAIALAAALIVGGAVLTATTMRAVRAERTIAASLERERTLRTEADEMAAYCRDLFVVPGDLALDRGARLHDLLQSAAAETEQGLSTRPLLRADVLSTIAESYAKLGFLTESRDLYARVVRLRNAHDETAPEAIAATLDLGEVMLATGRAAGARRIAAVAVLRIGESADSAISRDRAQLLAARSQLTLGMTESARAILVNQTSSLAARTELLCCDIATNREPQPEAVATLLEAFDKHDPGYFNATVRIADAYAFAGRGEQACELLRKLAAESTTTSRRLAAQLRCTIV